MCISMLKPKMVIIGDTIINTLVSAGHQNPKCKLGLDLDKGFNACYVNKWRGQKTEINKDEQVEEVVYIAELGGLGETCSIDFLRTDFDKEVDASSSVPGSLILEKMVSWTYLGELVRVVLQRLRADELLFCSASLDCALFAEGSLQADRVVDILGDTTEHFRDTGRILGGLGVQDCTGEELQSVQYVCRLIIQRAACLAAAALATLINRLNQRDLLIVMDGELNRKVPDFYYLMSSKTQELVKPRLQNKFHFVSAFAGGYIGAARMAAAANTLQEKTNIAEKSDAAGNTTCATRDVTRTTENNTDLDGNSTNKAGNDTNTNGNDTNTTGNDTNYTELDGNSTNKAGNDTNTTGNDTNTAINDTTGNGTGMDGNNTNTTGNDTNTTGNDTGIVGNNKNTTGNNTNTTGKDTNTTRNGTGMDGNNTNTTGNDTNTTGNNTNTTGNDKDTAGNDTGIVGNNKSTTGKNTGTAEC